MKKLALFFLLLPYLTWAQVNGIHFEKNLDWKTVQVNARKENKYVFIDCYATWCGPCKYMSDSIFPKQLVGDFFNKHFISISVQMDTTKNDNNYVKSWYADAHILKKIYGVESFPTYLFFAPDGHIVHREIDATEEPEQFIVKAQHALDPQKQYYTLMQLFEQGKRDSAELRELSLAARKMDQHELATGAGNEYIRIVKDVFSEDNLRYVGKITTSSKDKGFQLYLHEQTRINQIMGQDYAERKAINIIMDEDKNVIEANQRSVEGLEVVTVIAGQTIYEKPAGKTTADPPDPDWDKMFAGIKKNYGLYYADRIVKWVRIHYYNQRQMWSPYTRSIVEYLQSYPDYINAAQLNDYAYNVFNHSDDKNELNTALHWIQHIVDTNKNYKNLNAYLDTYANLLYKLGRRDEAIKFEERAIELTDAGEKEIFEQTLAKIKRGEKTWD